MAKSRADRAIRETAGNTPQPESPTLSSTERAAWGAVHRKVAKEMDEAFVKNVAKNRAIQDQKKAARVSPDVWTKIDREMNAAFAKNVAKGGPTMKVSNRPDPKVTQQLTEKFAKALAVGLSQAQQALKNRETPMEDVIYRETDQPEPVTPETPLEGLETKVLKVWKQTPAVSKAHQQNPLMVETAVRRAVFDALGEEARLRADGKAPHEAQEFTRPAMWTAPTLPVR